MSGPFDVLSTPTPLPNLGNILCSDLVFLPTFTTHLRSPFLLESASLSSFLITDIINNIIIAAILVIVVISMINTIDCHSTRPCALRWGCNICLSPQFIVSSILLGLRRTKSLAWDHRVRKCWNWDLGLSFSLPRALALNLHVISFPILERKSEVLVPIPRTVPSLCIPSTHQIVHYLKT